MKKIILSLCLVFASLSVFSQVVPKKPESDELSWRILQSAQYAFDRGKFAKAMNLANKAKANRVAESEYEVYILDVALSPLAVRRAGDDFDDVLAVLKERDQIEAIFIINRYLELYGAKFFGYSVQRMASWVREKQVYPEADFLIGKIYRLEGEYKTSLDFYEKARSKSSFLDIPDQLYDILYEMADLIRLRKNNEEYKKALLLILDNDPNYKDMVLRRAMLKIIDANKSSNVDRFFDLFRATSPKTLKALYNISLIFEEEGEVENSLFASSLGSVESFSHILDSISGRDAGFEFTTLAAFFQKISEYEDIRIWCEQNHFWENLINFCKKVCERGDILYGNAMLEVISENSPDAYTRSAAKMYIVKQ